MHKIVFIMRKPNDLRSYVALDDISIIEKDCEDAVTCDFDDDVCSYGSAYKKADNEFARFVGKSIAWSLEYLL